MLDKHFSVIFITLGRDCNFDCKYCLQDNGHFHQRKCIEKPELSEKLFQFLDEYKYDHTKIMLWGGEPLLYIDSIKILLERYKSKFDWGIITNGILLNEDIIELFGKYRVSLTVSHDGEATEKTRGTDVLKNERIKNLLKNYSSFTGFSSVYSSCNNNYRKLFQYFDKIGFDKNNVNVDMIYNTSDTTTLIDLANIKEEDYKKTLLELFEGYEQQELHNNNSYFKEWKIVKEMIDSLKKGIEKEKRLKEFNVGCSTCRDMLNIDYNGDVFICHNSTYKIGTIDDSYETIREEKRKYFKKYFTPKCKECSAAEVCLGACLLLTEKGQETFCNLRRIKLGLLCDWLMNLKDRLPKGEENND